jgi:two-component system chemotaxis response regulator CheY
VAKGHVLLFRDSWKAEALRVLLVDDSVLSRKVQLKVLQELSLNDVVEAKNGVEALRRLEELKFEVDIVLTDWNMPAMDGVTFVRELRKLPRGRRVPVIVVSSEGEEDKIATAFEAGANSYVTKPFKKEVLSRKIQSVKSVAALPEKHVPSGVEGHAGTTSAAALSGDLSALGFAELVQFLNFSRKTGELIVRPESGEGGVSFGEGQVKDAWLGRTTSEEAFFSIARLRTGRFEFHEGRPPRKPTIKQATLGLLMEAMRLADEANAAL